MRVAFVYGPMSLGSRWFDFSRLYDDPRGLTGSELSCVEYARHMARRGHDVKLLVAQPSPGGESVAHLAWEDGVTVFYGARALEIVCDPEHDAVCVWNEPDILRGAPKSGTVRLVNQQLNDWTYCQPGFADFVDVFTSPSEHHMQFIAPQAPGTFDPPTGDSKIWATRGWNKWRVLPNGCDPTLYAPGKKVPGRVLWASSPDRGLHLLLQAWPLIRRRVPHATLHCLYNFAPGILLGYEEGSIGLNGLPVTPDILELARRYRYIEYAMKRLADYGVVQRGSVSRRGVAEEMSQAEVLAYPCSTIRYTEGFSVSTMEACAAGAIPVITAEDALPSIYGEAAVVLPVDPSPVDIADAVVDRLDSPEVLLRGKMRALAAAHAWPVLAERLERILQAELEKKRGVGRFERGLWVSGMRSALVPEAVPDRNGYASPTGPTRTIQVPVHDRWTFAGGHPTGPGAFDYVICGKKSPEGFPCKLSEGHGETDHRTFRGPYEVEGNPAPPGARVAEWYVNHRGFGHTIMRYWVTDDIMVGGSIYDAAEWEYLQRRYGLTHVLNVENQNSDEGKDILYLYETGVRRDDDGSPRDVRDMVQIADWANRAPAGSKFYVHCTHGGSRSPAYGYLLARVLHRMTREEALAAIHQTRPEYGDPQFPQHLTYLDNADEAVERWQKERPHPLDGAIVELGRWEREREEERERVSAVLTSACKMCDKACERWQVFCGAACCARWEAGERPGKGAET